MSARAVRPPDEPLPIDEALPRLIAALAPEGACGVLASPPGSGKTTRVPPAIVDGVLGAVGEVVVLEPRRVAARAAARRVAHERGSAVGEEVGYQVRHDRKTSAKTRIRFVTEGVLLRQLLADPFLEGVGAVVLDEFHERHVEGDLALAMLREVRSVARPDLRLVVMSATLEADPILAFLRGGEGEGPTPFLCEADGRLHDVDVRYQERPDDRPIVERVPDVVAELLDGMRAGVVPKGDVLVFLPGIGEIQAVGDRLKRRGAALGSVRVLELHGSLSPQAQDAALTPSVPGEPTKIVLATNLAESSLTIPGVTAVVDSGLARVPRHDAGRGLDVLELVRISRASAEQRAGRAGRTAAGVCRRLWTRAEDRGLLVRDVPEIKRIDLAGPALQVRAFTGGRELEAFGWFEAPSPTALARADGLLRQLGALDDAGRPGPLGARMLDLPLHPRLARVQLAAQRQGPEAAARAALVVAMLGERPLLRGDRAPVDLEEWLRRFERAREAGFDLRRCESLGVDRRAAQAIEQAARQIAKGGRGRGGRPDRRDTSAESLDFDLVAALLAGFPDRLARVDPDSLATTSGRRAARQLSVLGTMPGQRGVRLEDPELASALAEEELGLFLALAIRGSPSKGGGSRGGDDAWGRVDLAVTVEFERLRARAEADGLPLEEVDDVVFDAERGGSVRAVRRLRFLDLVLRERVGGAKVDPVRAAERLGEALVASPERWLGGREELDRLAERIAWLATRDPALGLPAAPALADFATALVPSCAGEKRLADLCARKDLADLVVRTLCTPEQARALRERAPDRIELPSGRRAAVRYDADHEPTIAARMQELFGLTTTPRLGRGGPALRLELLAPNGRPQQITLDLASFWDTTWPSVRAELKRRYPKHDWPEDPRSASPVKAGAGRGRGRRRR